MTVRAVLRCALMDSGAQCVMMPGELWMHKLLADILGFLQQVRTIIDIYDTI